MGLVIEKLAYRGLYGVNVGDSELLEHDSSCSCRFTHGNRVIASEVPKNWRLLRYKLREHPGPIVFGLSYVIVWPKSEHVFLPGMPMKIQKYFDVVSFQNFVTELLQIAYLWEQGFISCFKLPV